MGVSLIEVYCDESSPDALTSASPKSDQLFLGSLWVSREIRGDLKRQISDLRISHGVIQEVKWNRISPRFIDFHKELIDLFMESGPSLRFRSIAVPVDRIRYDYNSDREHRFYVFYQQLLKAWLLDSDETHQIFLDAKTLRDRSHPRQLEDRLRAAVRGVTLKPIQSVESDESYLMQLSDLLLGCVQSRMNAKMPFDTRSSSKQEVVLHLEELLGRKVGSTSPSEPKFNVFQMHLQSGHR